MAVKKNTIKKQSTGLSENKMLSLFCPCNIECLLHINQLFCHHLFIDWPHAMKIDLMRRYFAHQTKMRTAKMDELLDRFIDAMLVFHDHVHAQKNELEIQWRMMSDLVGQIHAEMKNILQAKQHDAILPHEKIISLEEVLLLQAELRASASRHNITFSL